MGDLKGSRKNKPARGGLVVRYLTPKVSDPEGWRSQKKQTRTRRACCSVSDPEGCKVVTPKVVVRYLTPKVVIWPRRLEGSPWFGIWPRRFEGSTRQKKQTRARRACCSVSDPEGYNPEGYM